MVYNISYDSKIIIVEEKNKFYDNIAILDLCCMGYNNHWDKLFDKELGNSIYFEGRKQNVDQYGEKLKYATFQEVLDWCNKITDKELLEYRRFKILKSFLSSLDLKDWTNIIIIHYGY